MNKFVKWILISIAIVVITFFLAMLQPWVFLPHKHIEIILPFASEADSYTGLIPMGEKIEHNESNGNENGHPGIDFGWGKETAVLAIADGLIMSVSETDEGFNITQNMGFYRSEYKELNSVEPGLHMFSLVKKGQVLGYSGHSFEGNDKFKEGAPSGQIHWDFASSSMLVDRLCPLGYFDKDSRDRIKKIWDRVPSHDQFKTQYPEICNGFFKNKEK